MKLTLTLIIMAILLNLANLTSIAIPLSVIFNFNFYMNLIIKDKLLNLIIIHYNFVNN